ncbi:hypothetical protein BU24DRAFT_419303 [Aaosphaeria arxii CBS 175.79]|uniref:Altered inheritance of mitochondria protein 21 n=1 Tax=Aaosphaeria arxii CBS 175.79 TaxID=1450172 RepID=A0A6A5Y475_9PLEO|nr:uncharacterized protein BU24DRAFT_419303 [Aaosphaeria arxii CBS 175.79]KAF2019681.1 hypothetical protein BU24DRAFT_419303 [Aaosphaeria arxii CBS 175.79]
MSTPAIPPRPSRSQNQTPSSNTHMDVPKVPPRPGRRIDRSVSPNRDTYAPSPLNDPSFVHSRDQNKSKRLSTEVPDRPPSVSLPSLGQEGSEYASFDDLSKTLSLGRSTSPHQTKNVAGDLPLHAPRASVPSSTAHSRIQTVTRTDSSQAVAAGVGSLAPEDKSATTSEHRRSDSSTDDRSRPASMYKEEEEQGIPEIGVQVPMYPNAGDVQAPTPGPQELSGHAANLGPSERPRHHGRTKSGREIFHGPPGSYGLHGHGVGPKNEFDKQWYAKHPEDAKREKAGEYGPHVQVNRKDYHWMGDDLVKLVHSSGAKGVGMGTSREAVGTPDEQIGYMASEEFASRMASTSPHPKSSNRPISSGKSAVNVESPLRHSDETGELGGPKTDGESEDVIHIDPPTHSSSKIHGGGYDPPTQDLGAHGGNTEEKGGWVTEQGHGTPILASDELKKYPGTEHRQPAVDPELERRRSGEYIVNESLGQPAYITKQRTHSRSSSRNKSISSAKNLQRFASPTEHDRSGTPLESTKEYEPLFPDDDVENKKPKSEKRPAHAPRHHFPSQDVWEDSPSSHHLETTVDSPQLPEEPKEHEEPISATQTFEKPEDEAARKDSTSKEDKESFLPEHTKHLANKHLKNVDVPTRPGLNQRFPSHDIWEDAPDHGQLVTTVSTPQSEDVNEYADDSPIVEKPAVPSRPIIPARPQKPKDLSPVDKKAPVIPDRPKPQVPARPTKTISSDKVPTVESQGEAPPQPKTKPQVPARPGSSKIAALQAGFLKDLNSKLGIGPQAPKIKEPEPEPEEAPKPLQDARKGRAKGPQRRKPQSSRSPAAAESSVVSEVAVPKAELKLSSVSTIWSIGYDGKLDAPAAQMAVTLQEAIKPSSKTEPAVVQTETSDDLQPVQSNTSVKSEGAVADAASRDSVEETAAQEDLAPTTTLESNTSAVSAEDKVDAQPELTATGGVPLETEGGPEVTLPGSSAETAKEQPELSATGGVPLSVETGGPSVTLPGSTGEIKSPVETKLAETISEELASPKATGPTEPIITQEPIAAERTVAAAEGEEKEVGQDAKVVT